MSNVDATVEAPETPPAEQDTLLRIDDLHVHFKTDAGIVRAVDGVSFEVRRGETLALVGESGCGKTTLGESILRLNREVKGTVRFQETDVMSLPTNELKQIRRHMQIVFQDPFGSLSPRLRVREIIGEGIQVHFPELSPDETNDKISRVLKEVGWILPSPTDIRTSFPEVNDSASASPGH